MPAHVDTGDAESNAYRFTRLSTSLFVQDLAFSTSDARPGTIADNVRLERLDGSWTTLDESMRGRLTLIVFGSVSCPMTFGSAAVLRRLHAEFGVDVQFVMLSVREAHPGEHFAQPQSQSQKREHARLLASETKGPWETLVDSIDGELHRLLAEKPNAAFLLAPNRKILFRSLWAGDETALRQALRSGSIGLPLRKRQSMAAIGPLGLGLGYFSPILGRSGRRARRELLLAAPPVAAIAALASMLPLPLHRRGAAALALVAGLVAIGTVACFIRLWF